MPRPYRFVIADDEKPVAAGLQGQLESLGYDVVAVVNDGQRAVEMCRRALPDAVFLDIEMPGMDGLAAARQIAEDPGTPVIIITGARASQPDRPGRRGRSGFVPPQAHDEPGPACGDRDRRGPRPRDPGRSRRTSIISR